MTGRVRCPKCGRADNLWEAVSVPGWRSIDEFQKPGRDRDVDWGDAEADGWASPSVGCGECGWEGERDGFERIGTDGEPLVPVHPAQLDIEGVPPS